MRKNNKLVKLSATVLFALILLTSCSGGSSKKERATLMTIGEYDVSYEIYRYALLNAKDERDGKKEEFWDTVDDREAVENEIRASALSALKSLYAVLAAADKYGIKLDDQIIKDKVSSKIAKDKEQYGGKADFAKALLASHMNESVYEFLLGVQFCQDELYYAMLKNGAISSDKEYIMSMLQSDELIRVKMVLVKFDSDGDGIEDGSREDKLNTANKVLELAKGGEDFDTLVADYGNDMFMFNNPDGYYMMRGIYFMEFEDAAFSLAEGEVSSVIETPAGYAVLKRFAKDPSYIEENYDKLASDYAACIFSLEIESMLDKLEVKTLDMYDKYSFSDIK